MKDLMKSNIYDVEDTIIVCGSCLKNMQPELQKMMDLSGVKIENYVVLDNELIKVLPEVISLSKNLKELINYI